jgi:hypothetical protein
MHGRMLRRARETPVKEGRQPQNSQGARRDGSADAARPRRRGDRLATLHEPI